MFVCEVSLRSYCTGAVGRLALFTDVPMQREFVACPSRGRAHGLRLQLLRLTQKAAVRRQVANYRMIAWTLDSCVPA